MGNANSSEKENVRPVVKPKLILPGQDADMSIGDLSTDESFQEATPVMIKSHEHIMALVDPRSPTQEISRTPISLEEQAKRREFLGIGNPKLATLQASATPNNSINLSPFIDPRSPTQEVDRTPIRRAKDKDAAVPSTKINFQ